MTAARRSCKRSVWTTERSIAATARAPAVASARLTCAPTSVFCWLELVFSRLSVQYYEQFVTALLLGPVGINSMRLARSHIGTSGGAACWQANARDLHRFYSRTVMFTDDHPLTGSALMQDYGLGWGRFDQAIGHAGRITTKSWGNGLLAFALRAKDGRVLVVIVDRLPPDPQARRFRDDLVRSLN